MTKMGMVMSHDPFLARDVTYTSRAMLATARPSC